jgi:hypothetical protein
MSTNADSLTNKLVELELLIKDRDYDVVAVTESLPKNSSHDIENFVLEGYSSITKTFGRGVSLFVKEGVDIFRLDEIEDVFSPSVVCRLILPNKESYVFAVVYRSPNCFENENLNLNAFMEKLFEVNKNEKVILTGDFNYPDINWAEEISIKGVDHPASRFLECFHQQYLFQHITQPTHYRVLQQPNILDLVITNKEDIVSDITYLPPLGKSHHPVLEFALTMDSAPYGRSEQIKYQFNKGDYTAMREHVGMVAWPELLLEEDSVDECWSKISRVVDEARERFVPKVKIKNSGKGRKRKTLVPSTMLDKIKQKRAAFKTYKKQPTKQNYNLYAKARNQVKWESTKLVKTREHNLAKEAKINPKAFYQYVNSKTKPKEAVSNLLRDDGSLTQNDSEKADVLNKFFGSVFTCESDTDMPEFDCGLDLELCAVTVSCDKMCKALKALKVNKASGPDGLNPRILKELCNELANPLTYLFNKTMKAGKIPTAWKEAEVRPIFKKGDKSSAGNYRPVSLTSIVCKVFEGFVRDALCEHLTTNKLLSDDQFGFTGGRSCVTQLLVTLNDWFGLLEDGLSVDAVYLDLKKAFDTVPHHRLVTKLKGYGIQGNLLSWIADFLDNRTQFVSINGHSSEKIEVTSGVPQGSVLGPTLFVYFINDMPGQVDCKTKIFADDTKAYSAVDDTEKSKQNIQNSIDQLVSWTDKWLLQFNGQKCKILHFGKNNPQHQYFIKDGDTKRILESSTAEKDLGVWVDDGLTFENHVNEVVKKGNRLCGLLKRTITNKEKITMMLLFKALVRPVLEYGNPVWYPCLRKHINMVEGVQRRFTKVIVGMSELEYEDRLRKLKLPSLEYRRLRGDMIEVFKIVHGLYDRTSTQNLLTPFADCSTRGHGLKLTKPFIKNRQYKHFFTNRIISNWNNLPVAAVNADSLNIFKNEIDKFFDKLMYSTNLEQN